jgi:hypothetical protein
MSATGKLTVTPELLARLGITERQLLNFITKWKITELALFGSILRDDFGPKSDVDVMVTWADEAHWTLFGMGQMREELITLLGREIDLLTKRAVEKSQNHRRRTSILTTAQVVYAG